MVNINKEDDEIVTCPECKEEVTFLERKPDDLFCAKDVLYIALWIMGTSLFISSHWMITLLISFLVVTIYYLASTEVYCPKCSSIVSESWHFFFVVFILCVVLFFINMFTMLIFSAFYHGDAYYGNIVDGHYYLGYGHQNTEEEVPWYIYHLSLFGVKLHFYLSFLMFASFVKGSINKYRS